MAPEELDKVLNDYYRSGSPEQAVVALAHLSGTPEFVDRPVEALIAPARLFQAIARKHPAVIPGYRALLADASAAGRRFVQAALEPPKDAPLTPIRNGADLDQRWSEFLVTGEPGPVREILAVLSWPELLRPRIENFLAKRGWLDLVFGKRRRRELLAKLAPLGIFSDETGEKLKTLPDLDCHTLMKGVSMAADQAKALQQALPTRLDASELTYMATKATAKWSLCSNARQHPTVLKVCTEALNTATGAIRLSLLQIVAEASLPHDPGTAAAMAQEYLDAVPEQ